ncbi:MAG: hypothetical protein AB1733_22295 [Thermodesulfobacteriota bacterium]
MVRGYTGPGDDVEAWCTRCRMNLNHRVIAVVGKEIKRVHCLTCGGDHRYIPPKYEKEQKSERRAIRVGSGGERSRKSVDRTAERAAGEWNTIMKDSPPDLIPRPYNIKESYRIGELIEHPTLGTGKVLDVLGSQRIQAIFKEGRKVLVCNRP